MGGNPRVNRNSSEILYEWYDKIFHFTCKFYRERKYPMDYSHFAVQTPLKDSRHNFWKAY